ncbi:hypothetical protein CLV59_102564 [Chitinophaga dinghuensis]|uniref:Uncharacterized protein n=1 Tax=Chitinophaga dinghuensis TaxID=1539050 RepID=A0A327W8Q6_9BACT|nr:hypothetical protein CLV59_102564 [Chitinophaga dinghuensis]
MIEWNMTELILYIFFPIMGVLLCIMNVEIIRSVIALNAESITVNKTQLKQTGEQRLLRVNLHAFRKRKRVKGNCDGYPSKRSGE